MRRGKRQDCNSSQTSNNKKHVACLQVACVNLHKKEGSFVVIIYLFTLSSFVGNHSKIVFINLFFLLSYLNDIFPFSHLLSKHLNNLGIHNFMGPDELRSSLLNLEICYAKILMGEKELHKIRSGIHGESQMPVKGCKASVV
uniref:Uncharacterized protein n=1 Tax=Malurus cyaneus samueli TaxID=2593467 RepID=A0A8C5U853_9PASS